MPPLKPASPPPRRPSVYILAALAATLTILIVLSPEVALNASIRGLRLWWDIVFPALLPFFIMSEILIGLGVVHFMGSLLEPLMRPVFRVPGVGAFVVAMGLASGYPIGAKLTTRLREQELIGRVEGERLFSFCNTADPLFMFGAVAVGMFGIQSVGGPIVAAHYISAIMVGVLLRFYRSGEAETEGLGPRVSGNPTAAKRDRPRDREQGHAGEAANPFRRALDALYEARARDGRAIGALLGDAARTSADTMMLVGGFIILFSVIIQILNASGIARLITAPAEAILAFAGITPTAAPAFLNGLFEITLGADAASKMNADLVQKVMMTNAVIAWSGLSVHGQVAAIISTTDMRYWPYLLARFLHALLAAAITPFLMSSSLVPTLGLGPAAQAAAMAPGFVGRLGVSLRSLAVILAFLGALGLLAAALKRLQIIVFRVSARAAHPARTSRSQLLPASRQRPAGRR